MNTGYIILGLAVLFIIGIIGVIVALAVVLRQNSKQRALASRSTLERALDPKNFYIVQPKRPGVDARAWMLSAPSLAAVVGLFCFSVLAYSFTELSTWTEEFRYAMVIIGAFTLAAGSEIGTYAAVKEIFRRSRGGKISKPDIGALFISGLATAAALFLSIAALMGARGGWPDWVVQYGPIGVIICTALDAYAGMMESGLYESTFDDRYEEWQEKYHEWCKGVSAQLGYSERSEQIEASDKQDKSKEAASTMQAKASQVQVGVSKEQASASREQAFDSLVKKLGKAGATLAVYRANPQATQASVAQALNVSRQAIGQHLARLERDGLIARNGNGVRLTKKCGKENSCTETNF